MAAAVLVLSGGISGQQTATHFVDVLTMSPAEPEESCSPRGRGCVSGGGELPLAIESLIFDRDAYVWSEDVLAEIVVVNRGRSSVRFPSSLKRPPCDELQRDGWMPPHASLIVEFTDRSRNTVTLYDPLTLYYGVDSTSAIDLAPNETIRFRVPIHLRDGLFRPEGFALSSMPIRMSAIAKWLIDLAPAQCATQFTKPSASVTVSLRRPD